jgi:hypothetical protein
MPALNALLPFVASDSLTNVRLGVCIGNDFLVAFGREELIDRLIEEVVTVWWRNVSYGSTTRSSHGCRNWQIAAC